MKPHEVEVVHNIVKGAGQSVLALDEDGKRRFYTGYISLPTAPDTIIRVTGFEITHLINEINVTKTTNEMISIISELHDKIGSITISFSTMSQWKLYSE